MAKTGRRNSNALSDEKLAVLRECVEDGWSIRQIILTHGTCWRTIKRHFPDYHGMDFREAGHLGGRYTSIMNS